MVKDPPTTRLVPYRMKPPENEPSENVGVQPLGCGCKNITLHPQLMEIAPILSEHYPQNLVLRGERARA